MSVKPLRIGVVGLGWVGTTRHIPTIRQSSQFELVGIADRSEERVKAAVKKVGGLRAVTAARLADIDWIDEVNAVSIATAPFAHHDLACEGLERGLAVITEKPFAMTRAEGQAMVEAAQTAGRKLAVVHNFQFARSMMKLERDLARGAIGAVRAVRAVQLGNPARRLPAWFEQLPFGLFYDESPHLLYLLGKIGGPLELVKSVVVESSRGTSTPHQVDAWFRSPAGFPITLSCCFETSVSEWYLFVHGENSVGVVDIFRDIYLRLPNDCSHNTNEVLRTSAVASWQHWAQHLTSGTLHLAGRLRYGNDQVFARFAAGARGDIEAMRPIDSAAALGTLDLQHQIIANAERLSL